MANLIWCTDCGDSTGNTTEWDSAAGSAAVSTTSPHTGLYSVALAASGDGVRRNSVLADAGRRLTFWLNPSALLSGATIFQAQNSSGSEVFTLVGGSTQSLQIKSGGLNITPVSSNNTITNGSWQRITVAFTITSVSNFTIKIYVDGTLKLTGTASPNNLARTGADRASFQRCSNSGTDYVDDVYIDDGTGLDDPGNVRITRKAPNATSTNNFSTAVGSATNRWDYTSEVPISESKGWSETGSTQQMETYGIQNAATGDADLTGATILGHKAWMWAKRDYGDGEIIGTLSPVAVGGATATHDDVTLGFAAPVGATIVVCTGYDDNQSVTSVTDSGGNTYTGLTAVTAGTGTSPRLQIYYSTLTTALTASSTISLNHASASKNGACGIVCFAGVGSPAQDKTSSNTGSGTTQTSNATATLSQAAEIGIGVLIQNTGTAYGAAPTGFTNVGQGGSSGGSAATNIQMTLGYLKQNATTAMTAAATGANVAWAAEVATFRVASDPTASAAGTPKLVDDGTDIAKTLTTTSAYFENVNTGTTYPASVGLKSTGSSADTYLYECGIQIAYIPAAGATPLTQTASDNANNLSESLVLGRGNLHTDTLQSLGDAFSFAMGIPMILGDDANNLADGMVYTYGVTATGSDDLNLLIDALVKLLSYELALADSEAANWADSHQLLLAQFLALSDSQTITDSTVIVMEEREVFADAFTDYFTLSETVEVVPGYAELLSDSLASLSDDYSQILNQLKSFSDSLTLSDSEVHILELQLAFTESITLSDSLVLGYGLTASETITLTDGFSLGYGLTVSDAISLADAFGLDLSYLLSAADTIVLSDSEVRTLEYQETFTDSFSLSDDFTQVEEQRLAFSDQVTLADNFTVVEGLNEIVEDAISLTDVFSLGHGVSFTDDADNLADSATVHVITNTIEVDVADSFTLDDFLVLGHGLLSTDSFSLGDSASLNLEYRETASDSIFFTDAEDNQLGLLVTFADDINSLTDSYAQRIEELEAFTDTLATPDDSLVLGFGLLNDDTLVLSDSTSLRSDWFVQSSDTLTQSDSLALGYGLLTTDSFSLSDSVDLNIEHRLALSDNAANLTDSIEVVLSLNESASDSISLGDSTTQLLGYESRQADTITLTDTPGLGYGLLFTDDVNLLADSIFTSAPQGPQIFLAFTDSIDNLTDSETNFAAGFLSVSDSVNNLADDYTQQATGRLAASDSFAITDSVSVNLEQREAFADLFTLTDTEQQLLEYRLDLSDNAANWADSLTKTGGIPLNFSDNGPSLSDSVSLLAAGQLAFTETLNLTDSFRKTGEGQLPLDDSITLDDSVDFLLLGPGRDEGLSDSLVLSDAISILVGNELPVELVFSDTIILADHYFDLRYPYIPSTKRHIVVSSRARTTIVPDRDVTSVPASDRETAVPVRGKVIVPASDRTTSTND